MNEKANKLLHDIANRPHIYLKGIVAAVMVIGGLYLAGPFYVSTPQPGTTVGLIGQTLASELFRITYGAIYMSCGLMIYYGLWSGKRGWTARGLYYTFLFLIFTTILILATNGLRPLSWLTILALSLVSAVLWIRIKFENLGGKTHGH